uniref:Uncharacterized protein n=1 Tax=Anguilla anguilla TaxID=7936 RepID=A0A0E9PLI3_ANGAN
MASLTQDSLITKLTSMPAFVFSIQENGFYMVQLF